MKTTYTVAVTNIYSGKRMHEVIKRSYTMVEERMELKEEVLFSFEKHDDAIEKAAELRGQLKETEKL